MKRTKFRISIIALALVFLFSVAAFFAINFNSKSADAAGTVSVSSLFNKVGGANVVVDKQGDGDDAEYYTMFLLTGDDDNISFRKNLAYSWYEYGEVEEGEEADGETQEGEEEEAPAAPVVHNFFNMEIGFKNTNFEKFVIAFESQQYHKTEEGKTVNYVMFFPDTTSESGNFVKVLITDDKDATVDDVDNDATLAIGHIHIRFTSKVEGGYVMVVSENPEATGDSATSVHRVFENVGGNYAKSSSSTTTPVYPLIFSAEFDEESNEKEVAQMVLYCLNNQRFAVKNAYQATGGDYYTNGTVNDDTPAALCLNKEISNLKIGGSVSFDYQLIDVLRSSPSSTLHYYVLEYDDTGRDINFDNYKAKRYKEVDSDVLLESDEYIYLPTLGKDGGTGLGRNFNVDMAVKVYAEVKDTSSNGEYSYVFLDWYVRDELKLTIDGYDFIAVGDDVDGITYNTNDATLSWQTIVTDYQIKVDDAAKDLSAGTSSYFYLPSAELLFASDATAYSDMKISIYYYSDTQSSNTSLASNNLSINVTKTGSYRFTLYATDAAGNNMYYIDEDGELVEFSSSEIWEIYADDDRHDYLPWFTFNVDYKGVQFKETPGKQSTAYVGTTYSSASFEINGVDNKYEVKYRLFLFDRAGYYADTNKTFSYEEFLDVMDDLFENNRIYFKEIKEVTENDEDYEEFKDYEWNSSSTSFVPQDGNAFYYMRAEVTDTEYNTDPVTCSLAIIASVEAKQLKGDSDWLQNNVASVILLSVAGVSLIAIILLLVIKPKDKEDIDVQFEKLNKKKK